MQLFDTYGDSTIPTSVKKYFEQSHVKYVMLEVKDRKDMILPACSLQFDENVYFIPLLKKKNSCVFTIARGDFGYGSSMRLYHQLSRDLWWRVDSSSSRPDRNFFWSQKMKKIRPAQYQHFMMIAVICNALSTRSLQSIQSYQIQKLRSTDSTSRITLTKGAKRT